MLTLETIDLSKRFGQVLAVDDVSLRIEPGQTFGFLGPNGSGKTTTIGMIVGIVAPTSGHVRLFGSESVKDLQRARKRVGGTLEQPNFYPYLTGWDNLRVVASIKGVDRRGIERALNAVAMTDAAKYECRTYSLGMKQRLSLAAAMLGDPDLLILDEPTNGLDPDGVREIRELIQGLAKLGKTIFLSSHLLSEVERVCSHVAIIKNGRLLRSGPVEEIVERSPVVRLRATGIDELLAAVERYPGTLWAKREADSVVAELREDDAARLNRYLSDQNVYLSELSRRDRSLEEVFIDVTSRSGALPAESR